MAHGDRPDDMQTNFGGEAPSNTNDPSIAKSKITEAESLNLGPDKSPNPSGLSYDTLQALRKAGYPKPEGVSWPLWMGPKKLGHRHELICMYAASGKSNTEIARDMGYTDHRMSIILNTPRVKMSIQNLRNKLYGEDVHSRFQRMLPKAVDVVEKILDNPQERPGIRLKAANELMNRAIGKPKETVEIKTNSIRDVFEYLDRMRNGNPTSHSHNNLVAIPSQQLHSQPETITIEVEATPVKNQIDSWISENVPTGVGIGKGKPA